MSTSHQSKFVPELATTKPQPKTKSKTPPAHHYVNNKEMLQYIIEHRANIKAAKRDKKPTPKIPDIIGKQLYLIAVNLSHKPNFNNYTFKDEMVGDAIENCLLYFNNFDPKRSKYPFAYFTKIIYYAFVRRIQREKKHLYVKYKATQLSGILHEGETGGEDHDGQQFELYDNINEFVHRYEQAQAAAKLKQAAKQPPKPMEPKKGLEKLIPNEDD